MPPEEVAVPPEEWVLRNHSWSGETVSQSSEFFVGTGTPGGGCSWRKFLPRAEPFNRYEEERGTDLLRGRSFAPRRNACLMKGGPRGGARVYPPMCPGVAFCLKTDVFGRSLRSHVFPGSRR